MDELLATNIAKCANKINIANFDSTWTLTILMLILFKK